MMMAAMAAPAFAQGSAARTLRVIPQANLTSLDPVWTTAVVTRNHGMMVYDNITTVNLAGEVRPQMAEGWEISAEGRQWDLRPKV
jgi:peptide/nickel transport system substrate-binding protein